MHRLILATLFFCCLFPMTSFAGLFRSEPLPREITSAPEGAAVYLAPSAEDRGVFLGATPFSDHFEPDKFPAGYYRLEKKGFKTQSRMLAVPTEKPTGISMSFTLQPITTIYLTVTSKPSDATIFFGYDRNNISKKLGPTPYREARSDESSEEKPFFEKGYYRAILPGYRPKVLAVDHSSESMLHVDFDLEPLPPVPTPPRFEYPDALQVAYKPVSLDAVKQSGTELSGSTPIVVITIKEAAGKEVAGSIIDALILKLQRKGYVVVEREIVEKTIAEINAQGANPAAAGTPVESTAPAAAVAATAAPAASSSSVAEVLAGHKQSTGIELMKQLAEQLRTRYFIIGTLAEYSSSKEDVTLIPFIPDQEKERYQKEYDAYVEYYKSENLTLPQPVKTVKEWDREYGTKAKTVNMNVARVGLTAKMLDIKSGKAVWTGIVNSAESGYSKAIAKIVDAMVDHIAQ